MWASVTSTEEVAPDRIAAAVSSADHCQTGPFGAAGLRDAVLAFPTLAFPLFLTAFAALLARTAACFVDFFAGVFFEARFTILLANSVLPQLRGRGYGPAGRVSRLARPAHRASSID
jgi:hypothetical protein